MSTHRIARLVRYALVVCFLAGAAPAAAQTNVFPVQGLLFGTVTPTAPVVISPNDPQRRAELEVRGKGQVNLTFILPSALVSATGHTLPVTFGPGDGLLKLRKSATAMAFDPTSGASIFVPQAESGAVVYLGGTADPRGTPPGTYTAVVTVQIVQSGT